MPTVEQQLDEHGMETVVLREPSGGSARVYLQGAHVTSWRTADGKEFAPAGGRSLAPRQEQRLWKSGRPSAESIAAMAREYRQKFPQKAVISGLDQAADIQP